jgi:hypothetical protein
MAEGSMTWTEVAGRLAAARTYWLGSTTESGAPHAAPVWGVVTGDVVWAIRPRSAMAWRLDDYAASQRRWPDLS